MRAYPVGNRLLRLTRQAHHDTGARPYKRTLDWALCLASGLPVLVLVAVAAAAVKLDTRGPALFSQTRVGLHGRIFRMWKLRTMVVNAGELEPQLQHLNQLPWPDFKITRDPRVTRVGRWLRRTSIDELPQIWNVARGEMSWVGPRPTPFGLERYRAWHGERLEALPGITGLWQVVARAACNFDDRVRMDIAYVRNASLALDLRLLLATVDAVWSGRGAV